MHVEHETSDRHRRIAAVMDDLVPVLVAQLGDVHAEGDQQVKSMARGHAARGERPAQADSDILRLAGPGEFGLEQIQQPQLLVARQARMVGDVVGGAHEIVEGEDQRPMLGADDPGRDRKVLVPVCLAGSQIARGGHGRNSYQV